jgi:hypothetical protein
LHNDSDSAGYWVGALDGERDAFTFFVKTKDEELAGLLLASDAGRMDDKLLDVEADDASFDDVEHEVRLQR